MKADEVEALLQAPMKRLDPKKDALTSGANFVAFNEEKAMGNKYSHTPSAHHHESSSSDRVSYNHSHNMSSSRHHPSHTREGEDRREYRDDSRHYSYRGTLYFLFII